MMNDACLEWYVMEIDDVAKAPKISYRGLEEGEAECRLREFGSNKQEEPSI